MDVKVYVVIGEHEPAGALPAERGPFKVFAQRANAEAYAAALTDPNRGGLNLVDAWVQEMQVF